MSMRWLARILATRRGRIVASLVLLYLLWQAWLTLDAPRKIAPDLARTASGRGTVDVLVTLPFPPERFHILTFQRYGRISGTSGNTAEVRGVRLEVVRDLARHYWVRRLEPMPDTRGTASPG